MPVVGPAKAAPITWRAVASSGSLTAADTVVGYANGLWVATAGATSAYTYNPSGSWTAGPALPGTSNAVQKMAYANGTWVHGLMSGRIMYSTDPTSSWSTATGPNFSTNYIAGVATDGTTWVAVGQGGTLRYTTTPSGSWSTATSFSMSAFTLDVDYDGTYWCAVGSQGATRYTTSPAGSWTVGSAALASLNDVYKVTFANGYWTASGGGGRVGYRATDPTGAWTDATTPAGFNTGAYIITGLAYGGGYWLGYETDIAVTRFIATNPTGTWSGSTAGNVAATKYGTMAYGAGVFVQGINGTLYFTNVNDIPPRAVAQAVNRAAVF